jgi:hypothetical protein
MSRDLLKSIQNPYMLRLDRDLVSITNTSYDVLKYDVNLNENKRNIILKIIEYFLKKILGKLTLILEAHRSPRFRSIGIDIIEGSDPVLLANSICSICGPLHTFPNVVNDLLISALDFVI